VKTWKKRVNWVRNMSLAAVWSLLVTPLLQPLTIASYAQIEESPRVAVLDFQNQSAYGGNALARAASDAVTSELRKSGRYNVLSRQDVDQQLKELDLTPPLDRIGYLRMAQALQVQSIFVGSVRAVTLGGASKQAQVVLEVRVIDGALGEPVNGSIETGLSNPRPGYSGDDDTLVIEGLKNAAFDAVRTINTYTIPEATILNSRGIKEVILNKGMRGGIKEGMEMIVLRRGEPVGKIRVTQVSNNDATADIIAQTRGIVPEDRARAIFQVPEVKIVGTKVVTKDPRQTRGRGNQALKALGPLLVVALIVFAVGRGASGGNTPVRDVFAEASADGNFEPIIKVSWKTTLFAKDNASHIQWQVYRSDVTGIDGSGNLIPVGVVPGNQNFFIDTTAPRDFSYSSPPREGSEDLELQEVVGGPGIASGRSYTYQVALIYSERRDTGDGETTLFYQLSGRVPTGQATAITPATLRTPARGSEDADPRNIQFSWFASDGANAYVVEVSYDPTFTDRRVGRVFTTGEVFSTVPVGGIVSTEFLNIATALSVPTDRRVTLYWRVGSRNNGDSPGPVTQGGLRYVWTRPFDFSTQELPPPP
jgi:TolB-like protein